MQAEKDSPGFCSYLFFSFSILFSEKDHPYFNSYVFSNAIDGFVLSGKRSYLRPARDPGLAESSLDRGPDFPRILWELACVWACEGSHGSRWCFPPLSSALLLYLHFSPFSQLITVHREILSTHLSLLASQRIP